MWIIPQNTCVGQDYVVWELRQKGHLLEGYQWSPLSWRKSCPPLCPLLTSCRSLVVPAPLHLHIRTCSWPEGKRDVSFPVALVWNILGEFRCTKHGPGGHPPIAVTTELVISTLLVVIIASAYSVLGAVNIAWIGFFQWLW